MICNGCGGVLGRDCFNPRECEWIAQQQEREEYEHPTPDLYIHEISEWEREYIESFDKEQNDKNQNHN